MPRLPLICLLALAALAAAAGAALGARGAAASDRAEAAVHAESIRPWPLETPVRTRPSVGERAAVLAPAWVGVPYRYGGTTPSGFDCSGLTRFVYAKVGVDLPHNAAAQFALGRAVPRSRLRPGDLVFFENLGHVGLYLGRGRMIHAPQSGDRVEVVPLAGYYRDHLVGARRVAT